MVRSQQGRHDAEEDDPTSVLAVFIGHGVHSPAPLVSLYVPGCEQEGGYESLSSPTGIAGCAATTHRLDRRCMLCCR